MRIAIVTGGSKGLGKALCSQLHEAGYRVLEFSRTAPQPYSCPVDFADPLQAACDVRQALAAFAPEECSELLVFNNAASLAPIGPAWQKAPASVLANLNINFSAAILVINEVIRHFRHSTARKMIVNISSGAALKGYAGWSLYCASKAGLESFIRALAVEEARQEAPFLAVSIDPGVMDTDMQALIRATSAEEFPDVARFIQRKHEGGLSTPDTVASAILKIVAGPGLQTGGRYETRSVS